MLKELFTVAQLLIIPEFTPEPEFSFENPRRFWFGDQFTAQTVTKQNMNQSKFDNYYVAGGLSVGINFGADQELSLAVFSTRPFFNKLAERYPDGLIFKMKDWKGRENKHKPQHCLFLNNFTGNVSTMGKYTFNYVANIQLSDREIKKVEEVGCLAIEKRHLTQS